MAEDSPEVTTNVMGGLRFSGSTHLAKISETATRLGLPPNRIAKHDEEGRSSKYLTPSPSATRERPCDFSHYSLLPR